MLNRKVTIPLLASLCLALLLPFSLRAGSAKQPPKLLNDIVDITPDFHDFSNGYFLADHLSDFDPETASGHLTWLRNRYVTRIAFDNMLAILQPFKGVTFPEGEYAVNPTLPFSLEFISPRTVRIRLVTGLPARNQGPSLMLVGGRAPHDAPWTMTNVEGGYRYSSPYGSVTVTENPWHVEFRDADGQLLTRTNHASDNAATLTPVLPFSFVRRSSDYSRSVVAVFSISANEKFYGCGESFTQLDKRGQRVYLWANDPNGAENRGMYKPVPFFMSNRGYGMFVHSSTPMTFDFGSAYSGANSLLIGDDALDLFVFLGSPKEILDEYTRLTGRSDMPPLWSFGLWMSRITYFSEDQVRDVAAKLRQYKVPSDVIHLDTGWFETDWRCDYQFSSTRFRDPAKMITDLKAEGFHISLWQLPYFVPKNRLFSEIVQKGLAVRDNEGNLPYEDAILDFSNPETVKWYQEKIGGLLRMGVGAIKVDFGEAAPYTGLYASGRTGFYEHNLYPLRYQKAVSDITREVTGDSIMWARGGWAGCQRFPVHWGGDAANSDIGMAATLRGGLSIGLSGFAFWSHDIGGFTTQTPEELYWRWTPFGMLTSHSRSHGAPPKEPWEFSQKFLDGYRRADDLKYRLMPYIYAQAKDCTERGLPMVRALLIEFPDDPGSWLIQDEYLFGSDILVAPLMEANTTGRSVYVPPGQWIDYQTGKGYSGGWHAIEAGQIPIVMLVKEGSAIPHMKLAQSTMDMDWSHLELVVFATKTNQATGLVCLPSDNVLHPLTVEKSGEALKLQANPLGDKVHWEIRTDAEYRRDTP